MQITQPIAHKGGHQTVTEPATSSTSSTSLAQLVQRAFWWSMTTLCVIFAPIAAEFYLITVTHDTATYAKLLEAMVHADYAYGSASGLAQMKPYWQSMPHLNQMILGIHAALATLALLIGPLQRPLRIL